MGRDGADLCGWWFGPSAGGEMVWAYHPSRKATTPPAAEWNVPHDGAIDPTFTVTADRSLVAKKDKAVSSTAVVQTPATPRKQVRPQNALAKAAAAAATNVAKTSDNFQEKLKKESKDVDKKRQERKRERTPI